MYRQEGEVIVPWDKERNVRRNQNRRPNRRFENSRLAAAALKRGRSPSGFL